MALIGAGLITAGLKGHGQAGLEGQAESGLEGQGEASLVGQGEAELEGQGEAGLEGQGEASLVGQSQSKQVSVKAGLPIRQVIKEKFKCKYCPKSYVNKGSLVSHEKRDHVEGKKETPKVKHLAPVRLPEDREVESMIKSRKKFNLPPLKNLFANIDMITIKKTDKGTDKKDVLEKRTEKEGVEEKQGDKQADSRHDLEDDLAQEHFEHGKSKRQKFEYETGQFRTPYREKVKVIANNNKDRSEGCLDSLLTLKKSQCESEGSHDRYEMSHKRSQGSQEGSEGNTNSESVRVQLKRKFPGLTDTDFKMACSAALKNRRKTFPNAKSVQRREIVAEITKNMEVTKNVEVTENIEVTQNIEEQMEDEDNHNRESNHACKSCGKRYMHIGYLLKHIQKVHQTEVVDNFKCAVCEKLLKNKKSLKKHVNIHIGTKCDQCGEVMSTKHSLKFHMRNEHEEIVCDKCPFTGTGKEVEAHKHSKHRSGKSKVDETCTICSKVFKSRRGWFGHKKAHVELEQLEGIKEAEREVPPAASMTKGNKSKDKSASTGRKRGRKSNIHPAPLCEYEIIREQNIKEKEAGLKILGLGQSTSTYVSPPCPTQYTSPTSAIQVSGLKAPSQSFSVARTQ